MTLTHTEEQAINRYIGKLHLLSNEKLLDEQEYIVASSRQINADGFVLGLHGQAKDLLDMWNQIEHDHHSTVLVLLEVSIRQLLTRRMNGIPAEPVTHLIRILNKFELNEGHIKQAFDLAAGIDSYYTGETLMSEMLWHMEISVHTEFNKTMIENYKQAKATDWIAGFGRDWPYGDFVYQYEREQFHRRLPQGMKQLNVVFMKRQQELFEFGHLKNSNHNRPSEKSKRQEVVDRVLSRFESGGSFEQRKAEVAKMRKALVESIDDPSLFRSATPQVSPSLAANEDLTDREAERIHAYEEELNGLTRSQINLQIHTLFDQYRDDSQTFYFRTPGTLADFLLEQCFRTDDTKRHSIIKNAVHGILVQRKEQMDEPND